MPRAGYRHGDLRRALLEAGVALAREGGPEAVVLREATRRAGVAPNAAYRHFASHLDLRAAVRAAALAAVADAIEDELAQVPARGRRADRARAGLRAVGGGYLGFALREPGLFRAAFAALGPVDSDHDPAKAGRGGLNPFELLAAALDRLVDAQVLPAEQRPGAEYLAWSAVHGLAMLLIDGPLRGVPPAQVQALAQRLLQMVEKGL
ncbi:MAG: TetR/AcrR family transcriptional regulator [Comamonadaceae bacterium]|nr:MAG: TetR/AcrR family transcriptional regulator [Comamonadaceae bacterium]